MKRGGLSASYYEKEISKFQKNIEKKKKVIKKR